MASEKNYGALLAQGLSQDLDDLPEITGYNVLRKLGQGGMGSVYLAVDENLNREVAIKFYHNDSADPMILERVRQESEILARIQHPNVLSIYHILSREGSLGLVLEYAAGGDLISKIRNEGCLNKEQVVHVCCEICDGLQQIHQLGIIHRDIKPANILLSASGVAKVADLGIAKDSQAETLTMTGSYLGSMLYVAPEQMLADAEVDSRADIWAMGILIYELITGSPPKAVLESELMQPLPADVRPIVTQCLKQKPENRYQSVLELKQDLVDLVRSVPATIAPEKKLEKAKLKQKQKQKLAPWLIIAALLLLVSLVIPFMDKPSADEEGTSKNSGQLPRQDIRVASEDGVALIPLLKTPLDPDRGNWELLEDGSLHCERGRKIACLSFPVDTLGESYDLSLTLVRNEGRYSAAFFLPTSIGPVTLEFDGWGSRKSGIQALDGEDLRQHDQVFSFGLVNGVRYKAKIQVRRDYVDVYIDGEKKYHCSLAGKRGSLISLWQIPRKHKLSIAAWSSDMTFSEIVLKKNP